MTIAVFLLLALFLLLLNAFFVLAEFAAVKMRPSRTEALIAEGVEAAKGVRHIQTHLDEYLSVCQVGITFASIGLGFVGEPAFAELFKRLMGLESSAAHAAAVTAGYIIISSLHIVLGELLPKSLAIRRPEGSALFTARLLKFFHGLFYLPLVVLNGATLGILKLLGMSRKFEEAEHSEEELRIILAETEEKGLMSFERLLLLENIFDLRDMKVRDVMRSREAVKVLKADAPWEENLRVIRDSRFSRYPLLESGSDMPVGIIHVKDLFYEGTDRLPSVDLKKLARRYLSTSEQKPLEKLLGELRSHRGHLVMVRNDEGRWTGFLSLEDVVEEVVGSIEDEFEVEPVISMAEALSPKQVILGIEASSLEEAVGQAFGRVAESDLPQPREKLVRAVLERERAMSTYLGEGLAMPHARVEGLESPFILFARSETGIPVRSRSEKAHLIFILLSPAGSPRVQVRLLARIAGLLGSGYVEERLRTSEKPEDILDAIRAAESIAV